MCTSKLNPPNTFTAPWAHRSRYTWQWASARRRPCGRPGPCPPSSARRPWCRCSGRTGIWGTSCEGRSSAPGEDPCTRGRALLAGRGWGWPSCWNTKYTGLMWVSLYHLHAISSFKTLQQKTERKTPFHRIACTCIEIRWIHHVQRSVLQIAHRQNIHSNMVEMNICYFT